jgi:hypothetical protein
MRCTTVMTESPASRYTAGSRSSTSRHAGALREHEPGGQDDDADGPVGDADLALDAERLGAGARVGDHQRGEHGDDDGGDRQVVAAVGELVGDRR